MGLFVVLVAAFGLAAWAGAIPFLDAAPISTETSTDAWEAVRSETARDAASGSDSSGSPSSDSAASDSAASGSAASGSAASGSVAPENAAPSGMEGEVALADDGAEQQEVPEEAPVEVSEGAMNILVLGVDRRPRDQVEGYRTRTDTMMLVQIEAGTGEVELLSIPRDMYVETEPGVKDKINSAYVYGGISRARATVENFTGVPIHHYAIVDFRGFTDVVDAMGGVELEVQSEFPPNWKMEQGEVQTLDGRHALLYARYRGTPRADLERIERQQQLVAALRSQALSWESLIKLPEYVRVIDENIESDLGLEAGISLARLLIQHGRDAQMTATQLQGTPATLENGSEVLEPSETENEIILQDFRD